MRSRGSSRTQILTVWEIGPIAGEELDDAFHYDRGFSVHLIFQAIFHVQSNTVEVVFSGFTVCVLLAKGLPLEGRF